MQCNADLMTKQEAAATTAKGIHFVASSSEVAFALDRVHLDLDVHTADMGVTPLRTPVIIGNTSVPLAEIAYPALIMGVVDRVTKAVKLYAAPMSRSDAVIPVRVVVCAACKCGDYMLVGPRHFCPIMCAQAEAYRRLGLVEDQNWEQGFIDQWGQFMDRHEALLVAMAAGQPVDFKRNGGSGNELYSEGLY